MANFSLIRRWRKPSESSAGVSISRMRRIRMEPARMPTVDTLKDDMETRPPEELEAVWHILAEELDAINLFRGTRYENMPMIAIDGVDGFRTACKVPTSSEAL